MLMSYKRPKYGFEIDQEMTSDEYSEYHDFMPWKSVVDSSQTQLGIHASDDPKQVSLLRASVSKGLIRMELAKDTQGPNHISFAANQSFDIVAISYKLRDNGWNTVSFMYKSISLLNS